MSFSFSSGGGSYADKNELASKRLVFTVTDIRLEEGKGFEGDDRWALDIEFSEDPERAEEILTFGCNKKRDLVMHAAQEEIEANGPIKGVTLAKVGSAYYLNSSAEEAPKPKAKASTSKAKEKPARFEPPPPGPSLLQRSKALGIDDLRSWAKVEGIEYTRDALEAALTKIEVPF